MISLVELKAYLQARQQFSLAELSIHYQEDAGFVEHMLQHFIRKGQLRSRSLTPKCGTKCTDCDPSSTTLFEWCK